MGQERSQLRWLGHLFRMPSGGVPCVSNREEAPNETKDMLERPCLSAVLGAPQNPPGRAGGSVWGEGSLGVSYLISG